MTEIIPIEYAKSHIPESMVFHDGDKDKKFPIVFIVYIIKTETRTILVDAGCETLPGFEMRDFHGTVKALENHGFSPDDITDVIITHSHHDHIECVKYFPKAVIHTQKDEYENGGKQYIPDGFRTNIFTDSFVICENVEAVKIGGHSRGSCVVEIKDESTTFVIAGDECYSRLCLTEKRHTGSFYDEEASRNFVYKYSDEKYTVLLCHENK